MPELQALDHWPLFMQTIKYPGGEGVARAVRAYDGARGQSDRAQRETRSVASDPPPALGKGSRSPTHRAEREDIFNRPHDCGRVGRTVAPPCLASRQRADLVIIDDQAIEMR